MKHLTICVVVVVLLCVGGTRVEAQEVASSFDELAVLTKPGDKITVLDVTGRETKGRIGDVSGDALKNGAIIGAAAATAYFLTAAALLRDSDGGEVFIPGAVAGGVLFAGLGAAAGAGIDALIARRHMIYQKPAARSRVSVSPVFGHGRRGAAVTVKF